MERAERIVRYFEYLWELGEKASAIPGHLTLPQGILPGQLLLTGGPRPEEQEIYRWTLRHCQMARDRILVMTPFFLPSRRLLKILLEARERDVEITIITPLGTDKPRYDGFRALPAPLLMGAGARWYGTREYFHQKFFVCDEAWTIGSANFDIISMERNYELNLAGKGGPALLQLEEIAGEAMRANHAISVFPSPVLFRALKSAFYSLTEFFLSCTGR